MTSQEQAARENDKAAGVILLQIDGLSRHQLQKALDAGRLPFLERLLRRRPLDLRRMVQKLREREWGLHG